MKTYELGIAAALAVFAPALLSAGELDAPGTAVSSATAKSEAPAAKPQPASIAAGYRGTSIGIGGDQLLYVKKGDRVDVMVTFDARVGDEKGERKETMTATILQNVVVINLVKPAKPEGKGALELLLNPNEAQYLALSTAQAKQINIAVRAPGDTELHPMEMASFRRLIK